MLRQFGFQARVKACIFGDLLISRFLNQKELAKVQTAFGS